MRGIVLDSIEAKNDERKKEPSFMFSEGKKSAKAREDYQVRVGGKLDDQRHFSNSLSEKKTSISFDCQYLVFVFYFLFFSVSCIYFFLLSFLSNILEQARRETFFASFLVVIEVIIALLCLCLLERKSQYMGLRCFSTFMMV